MDMSDEKSHIDGNVFQESQHTFKAVRVEVEIS